ncbi:MAG: radical SAM protein [Staphylothermus sp.]|nr:radical SAM protein [Staphylothermus sp.]
MRLRTIYGPHISRCFGLSLGIDPLLIPKKCPYDCIYCPLSVRTVNKTYSPKIIVTKDKVVSDLKYFIGTNPDVFRNIEHFMIWGMGDPLLNYHTPLIIEEIRKILADEKSSAKIVLRTTGYLLDEKWVYPILEKTDYIVIPIDAVGELRQIINNPLENLKLNQLIQKIKSVPRVLRNKFYIEINLLRYNELRNSDPEILDELLSYLSMTGISKIFLKTINRPSWNTRIKPVRGKVFEKTKEYIENNGYKVFTCIERPFEKNIPIKSNLEEAIINHLLRKPLSNDEIRKIYGIRGIISAEKLVEANLVEKINWLNKIYFRARHSLDLYNYLLEIGG